MTRAEINRHPSVVPALEAWRTARAERDRILCDLRFGTAARKAAINASDDAFCTYDKAVRELLETNR